MRTTFSKAIARTIRRGIATAVVLDAAVLYEADWDDLCDLVVFVDAPREQRLERVEAGRGWTSEVVESRERAQWPLEGKKTRADVVVANTGDIEALTGEVARIWDAVRRAKSSRHAARDRTSRTVPPTRTPGRPGEH
jgi:dephospho-CoA kinase